jgi:hypothetical protein
MASLIFESFIGRTTKTQLCLWNFEVHQNYRIIFCCTAKNAITFTAIIKQTTQALPPPSLPW